METQNNDLLSNDSGAMSETKKALYDRLKKTMQKEAQETADGGTRRGFLHAIIAGGAAALGVGTLAVIGSSTVVNAGQCGNTISCGEGNNFVCDAYGVSCPEDFVCTGGFSSCEGCQTAYEECPETIQCIGCLKGGGCDDITR